MAKLLTLTNSSADVINVIANSGTFNYKDYIPYATPDAESIRTIGAIIMDYTPLRNAFVEDMINMIGMIVVKNAEFQNPLARLKQGFVEYGDTIEEVFVDVATAYQYDVEKAEDELPKRDLGKTRTAFHVRNYKKFYVVTIQLEELREAFRTSDGLTRLINAKMRSAYTAAQYDEFLVMKYLLAYHAVTGQMAAFADDTPMLDIGGNVDYNATLVRDARELSTILPFMHSEYNRAGVLTTTPVRDQYIFLSAHTNATNDVGVLASAFNMDKAEFIGNRIVVDSFRLTDYELTRVSNLLADSGNGMYEFSDDELEALEDIPAIVVGNGWFQIWDNLTTTRDFENGRGLYWNYFFHYWKTFSISPFANAILLLPGYEGGVDAIAVSPATATVYPGNQVQLSATVTADPFIAKSIVWSSADETVATVDENGLVKIAADADAGTVVITATSAVDENVSGTATITIQVAGEGD